MSDSLKRYHQRRNALLWSISKGVPHCAICFTFTDLEIHHVSGGHSRRAGGWQHVRQVESERSDPDCDEEHMVLCRDCHCDMDAGRRHLFSDNRTLDEKMLAIKEAIAELEANSIKYTAGRVAYMCDMETGMVEAGVERLKREGDIVEVRAGKFAAL